MTPEQMTLLAVAVGVIVLLALIAIVFSKRRRHTHLRDRFGPEYDRAVGTSGSVAAAEAALIERERRVKSYKVRTLTADERRHYSDAWLKTQAKFVESPSLAVGEADLLVTELMKTRGYPMADWEQRVEDLTVDHPNVCHHYREGREIARRQASGDATTEDLRQALVHYRALFTELLEEGAKKATRH